MKPLTFIMMSLLALSVGFGLIACNTSGGGGGSAPTPPSQPITPGLPAPCYYGNCPYGNGYNPNQTVNFYASKETSYSGGYYQQNPTQLSILSPFKDLLKNIMGVCDRMENTGGVSDCSAWQSGSHQIIISVQNTTSNQATLMIKSYPSQSSYYWYGYQLPSAEEFFLGILGFPTMQAMQAVYNPLVLNSTIWPKDAGFELRIESPPTYSMGGAIQIITSGKLEDLSFNFDLYYQAQKAATGKMMKY